MAARRRNLQFSVEEAARLVLEDESDDDDLDELLTEEELEDEGGFSNASDSDDDMDGTSQKTSGSCSSRERSTVSPPAKRSKRTDRAILTIDTALNPDNYDDMDLPSSSFQTFTACLGPAKKKESRKSVGLTNHQCHKANSDSVTY